MAPIIQDKSPLLARRSWVKIIRDQFFKNWSDTAITLASLAFIVLLLQPVLHWILNEARWEVLGPNLAILLRGRFVAELAWRIWVCLGLIALTAGLASGTWSGRFNTGLGAILALPLLLVLVPIFEMNTRLGLLAMSALIGTGFLIGKHGPKPYMKNITVTLLALIIPVGLVLLYGFGQDGPMQVTPPKLWGGLLLSLILALTGIVFSYPLGVILALGRQSKLPIVRMLSVIYIEFVRGVPSYRVALHGSSHVGVIRAESFSQYRRYCARGRGHHIILRRLHG